MRWVFQIFEGIHLLVESGGGASDIVGILNIREVHKKILSLLGESYGKMYLCWREVRKVGSTNGCSTFIRLDN